MNFYFCSDFKSGKVVAPSLSSVLTVETVKVEIALEKKSPACDDFERCYESSYFIISHALHMHLYNFSKLGQKALGV